MSWLRRQTVSLVIRDRSEERSYTISPDDLDLLLEYREHAETNQLFSSEERARGAKLASVFREAKLAWANPETSTKK